MHFLLAFSRTSGRVRLLFLLTLLALLSLPKGLQAHPMPNTLMWLDLQREGVEAEIQLPLSELQPAFGENLLDEPAQVVERWAPQLRTYLQQHVRPLADDQRPWGVEVRNLRIESTSTEVNGTYQELVAQLWLQPPAGANPRAFTLDYDVILHQVVTHIALVSIRQDWEGGVEAEHPVEVGVIRLDVPSGTIPVLEIRPEGSWWFGFRHLVTLGMHHIGEGTDHLLFLLVLLLPAPLVWERKRWSGFGGVRYSIVRLLQVVTAFTLGHSLTLVAGALGWAHVPSQPIEVLIAFSILLSAVHALRPLFPGRELYVAAGFGLIHGLAFAGTLATLHLSGTQLGLSLLGFNIGIELMQLFVVALTLPWLILLSRSRVYAVVRVAGAVVAGGAALAWMAERLGLGTAPLTQWVEQLADFAPWLVGSLAVVALLTYGWEQWGKSYFLSRG